MIQRCRTLANAIADTACPPIFDSHGTRDLVSVTNDVDLMTPTLTKANIQMVSLIVLLLHPCDAYGLALGGDSD